jgi:hypothetical protein
MRATLLLLLCAGCYDLDALSRDYQPAAEAGVPDDLAGARDLALDSDGAVDAGHDAATLPGWHTVASPVTASLRALTTDGTALYAVGASSTILRIAADSTVTQETLAPGYSLRGASAAGGSVWAVGDDGAVLQRSGAGWSLVSMLDEASLYSAFALDADNLLVTGSGGAYWTNQTIEDTGALVALFGLWARGATDVFAAGEGGTLLHRSDSWSALDSGVTGDLRAISGDNTRVLAVGAGGTILASSNGASFAAESSGTSADLDGLWLGDGEAFAVGAGGVILHRDGNGWHSERSAGADLHAVLGRSTTDVWAVGDNGTLLHYSP